MGVKISKHYSYKSQPKRFKLYLKFPPNGPYQNTLVRTIKYINFLFPIFNDFLSLYPMEKPKTSIMGTKRDQRAKRTEN